jgi:hypothetical protein
MVIPTLNLTNNHQNTIHNPENPRHPSTTLVATHQNELVRTPRLAMGGRRWNCLSGRGGSGGVGADRWGRGGGRALSTTAPSATAGMKVFKR